MTSVGRRPLVIGNWKMNLTEVWAGALVDELLSRLSAHVAVEVALAPAFPSLRVVADHIRPGAVQLAAQNVHWEDKGPFTGEVSPRMLSEIGVRFVIVGHSERRTLFGETDERISRKVAAVVQYGMVPVLCLGETGQQRDEGRTLAIVERQLRLGLGEVRVEGGHEVVIAYEPIWAIGTGRTAAADQVEEVHLMIREQLGSLYGAEIAAAVSILYGGSVTPDNAAELLALPEVDGALVGGASLDAAKVEAIVDAAGAGR
jgi:triosephosphate isomerase